MLIISKFIILYIISKILNISVLKLLPIILPILLAVAFFTIFERKILASMQRRRGPNVVGLYGLLQAIADALKLLSKETLIPASSNMYIFIFSPIFTFIISMTCWALLPFDYNVVITDINLGLLFLFALSSLGVYGIIMSGWSSNSKYAFLGSLRSSAQFISYEISIGLILVPIVLISQSFNLSKIVLIQEDIYNIYPLFPFFFFIFNYSFGWN